LAAEQLLDGEAEGLTRKLIEVAKQGDIAALRLCMDRLVPPRRDRSLSIDLPPLKSQNDAPKVIAAIFEYVSSGEIGIDEGNELTNLVFRYIEVVKLTKDPKSIRPIIYAPIRSDENL
jgi:hypothetical protein